MTAARSPFVLAVLAIFAVSGFFGFNKVNGAAEPVSTPSPEVATAVLIKVKPGVNAEQNIRQSLQQLAETQARTMTIGNAVQYLIDGALSTVLPTIDVQRLTPSNELAPAHGLDRWYVVENGSIDAASTASWLDMQSWVEAAELDERYAISKTEANDPYYSSTRSWGQPYADQWGLERIQAHEIWKKTTGSPSRLVAVIDTGIDFHHPELTGRIWRNSDETPSNGFDDDGNGFVDDVDGWNFTNDSNNPTDDHGHGTHVAGIIGAASNNGQGIASVAWQPRLMTLKGLNFSGSGRWSWLAEAIVYAADQGADVINMSFGGPLSSQAVADALAYAHQQGTVLVAAAGNGSNDRPYYPSAFPHVLGIGAWAPENIRAWFSNFGPTVDLVAPGVDILSLRAADTDMYGTGLEILNSLYYRASGTSMSAPFVAGTVALLRSEHPDATPGAIEIALESSAQDLAPHGRDNDSSYGMVRPGKALPALKKILREQKAELTVSVPSAWAYRGEPVHFRAILQNLGARGATNVYYRVEHVTSGQAVAGGTLDIQPNSDLVLDITFPFTTLFDSYRIVIDPDDTVMEYFNDNNSLTADLVLKWKNACPPPCH